MTDLRDLGHERTDQELLAERWAFAQQMRRSRDEEQRALLQWEIDQLTRVLRGTPKHIRIGSAR